MARTLQYSFARCLMTSKRRRRSLVKFRKLTTIFAFILALFFVNSVTAQINELKSGTKILVQMDNEINSRVSSLNDTFTVVVAKPVSINDVVVLPAEATIEGRITKTKRASTGGNNGNLEVIFETLKLESGATRKIEAVLVKKLKLKTSNTGKILTVIGGTALGGILGAITGTDKGALIGAGIGAGAGTGTALLQKGKDVRIKADQKFEIELTKSVTLPAEGF